MAVLEVTQGDSRLTVHNATHAGVAVLEHLGWEVVNGEKPSATPVEGGEVPAGNATREAWAEYAASLGVDVPEDAKRDDIKALVEASGD